MAFSLPELPYSYEALAPYMSRETLEFHHDKHHLAYVNNGNNRMKGTEFESRPMSISRPGEMARWLSCGMRLCPPASNLASPPCLDKTSSALRRVAGRSYSKTGGFIGLPPVAGQRGQWSSVLNLYAIVSDRTFSGKRSRPKGLPRTPARISNRTTVTTDSCSARVSAVEGLPDL